MTSRIDYNNPKNSGAFGLPYHYEMVSDNKRVGPFASAIRHTCKNKRVLESGTGSGIMSLLAAQAGAKKVYAVEKDPVVFKFAQANIKKSQYAGKIKLINKDITKVKLKDLDGERVDVVIAENLSTWQVTEPQVPILNYIGKNLAKRGAVPIPGIIDNEFELVHTNFLFRGLVALRTYYFEFTGIKKAANLSAKFRFKHIDLSRPNELTVHGSIVVPVRKSGVLNALRLTSPLKLYRSDKFSSSDSLMPPVIMPLVKDLKVKKGQRVKIEFDYRYYTVWEKFKCRATVLS